MELNTVLDLTGAPGGGLATDYVSGKEMALRDSSEVTFAVRLLADPASQVTSYELRVVACTDVESVQVPVNWVPVRSEISTSGFESLEHSVPVSPGASLKFSLSTYKHRAYPFLALQAKVTAGGPLLPGDRVLATGKGLEATTGGNVGFSMPDTVLVEQGTSPWVVEDPTLAAVQQGIASAQASQAATQFAASLLVAEETRDRLPATGAASEITQLGVFGQVSEINAKFPEPQPTMGSGRAVPVSMLEGPQVDAAGAIRVGGRRAIFDGKLITDAGAILWDDQQVSGGGTNSTHSTATASVTMSVSNLTAGRRIRQSLRRLTYQAGKGQLVQITGVIGAPVAGVNREMGQHDGGNGVFFASRGVTSAQYPQVGVYVVVRSSTSGAPVDTAVHQSQWKLDTMDGSSSAQNPSGFLVDWSKAQLFVIDYQWLSLGQVRFGLKLGSRIYYVHSVESENILATPWASTPHLPLRYLIENSGAGPAASLVQICSAVFTEDGVDDIGYGFSVERTTPLVTNNDAALYPIIAMRLKSTHLGSTVRPAKITIVCATNSVFRWAFFVNPTVVGVPFSFTPYLLTSVEVDTARTNATTLTVAPGVPSIDGGISQQRDEGSLSVSTPTAYSIGATISGVSEVLVLAVQRLDGAAETFYASLAWRDFQ